MKFVTFFKSSLFFILFLVFNYIIRNVGFFFFFKQDYIADFDTIDKVILYLLSLFIILIAYILISFIKTKTKKQIFVVLLMLF